MLCKGIRAHAKVAWQCMELTPVLSSAAKAHCKAWFPPASQDLAATGPDPALQASQPAVTCFFKQKTHLETEVLTFAPTCWKTFVSKCKSVYVNYIQCVLI